MSYVIFEVSGGIGKNIMATAVIKTLKQHYTDREIVVVTAWPDVYKSNPNVSKIVNFSNLGSFYDTYIKSADSIVFKMDPYHHTDYINRRRHVIDIWHELCGLPYTNKQPEIFFNAIEMDSVKRTIQIQKPMFVIQPFGGVDTGHPKYAWPRDLPPHIAQQVVNHFKDKYDIIQIKTQNQIQLENVFPATSPNLRQILGLMMFSEKRLLIDSFAQHAAAAFSLPSTVCWIGNSPVTLGYDTHDNIQSINPQLATTQNSYLEPYDISGNDSEYPFVTTDIFDVQSIIQSVEMQ